ncbi:MAG TPA: M23 family metallopeptidase [Longimicrobiales bacterium]|nr:M23 family metallopeptidase [Longimicrobiales bacterium]
MRLPVAAVAALLASPAVGLAQDAAPPGTGALPAVSWSPARPGEGELFVIRVVEPAEDPIMLIAGGAGGEPLHFERVEGGSFRSLAAVPLGRSSEVPLDLTLIYADGREEIVRSTVPVTAGQYNHRRLTVAPELGGPPDSAQAARRAREQARAAEVSARAHRTPRIWTGEAVLPKTVRRVTSAFGDGRIFNGQVSSRHTGLDLDGATGDTVVAAARGLVELVDAFELAGNVVYINHGGGLVTAYFHLSEQLVAEGDTVDAGTPIGRVGATGRVTGPHLHWVVRYGQTSVDGRSLLAVSEDSFASGG